MKSFKEYLEETIRTYGPVGAGPGTGYAHTAARESEERCDEEEIEEGRIKDIDLERQDYEKLSPLAFRNRYHMSKEQWHDKYRDLLEPKQQDNSHWDFGRILELAGVADKEYDKQDDAYCEDQSAGVVAQKELATDITNPMPGVHENRKN